MSRKISCILLALCVALSCGVIAAAAESDADGYTAALAALSASGISASSDLALSSSVLQLPIELGILQGDETLSLAQLSAQAILRQQEQQQQQADAVAAAAANAALLMQYDGVKVNAPGALNLRAAPDVTASVLRTLSNGKVAHLLDVEDGWYLVSFGESEGYVSAAFCQPVSYADYEGTWATSTLLEELIQYAYTYLGTPYHYGGASYSGTDCSGFTMAVFAHFGYSLPHGASDQYYVSRRVSAAERQAGDLVFFNTMGGISHVGLYLGGGLFIHANSSRGVAISSLYEPYYASTYLGAGRVIG